VQHEHWYLGTGLISVALLELVGSGYWKQAQSDGLRGTFGTTELKKKRELQSQFERAPLAALLQMQLDASRSTGQIYLFCMNWASETQQLQGREYLSFRRLGGHQQDEALTVKAGKIKLFILFETQVQIWVPFKLGVEHSHFESSEFALQVCEAR
jgi:hypothetical protein